jgi:hypothetical protein
MIFSIVIILLIFVVVYFHYLQGFFSSALSAIFAIVAAAVAIGWHETVIEMLLGGKYADTSTAMVVCSLFAAVYMILRMIADKYVGGAVLLPSTVDKVGGAAMGLVAGLVGGGIVAFAAQSMPFGPSIAGYSRLAIGPDRDVVVPPVPGKVQSRDSKVFGDVTVNTIDPTRQEGMFLPADDFLIGTVAVMSDGALSTSRRLSTVHPNWLLELWGQRAGIEPGARHTAAGKGLRMLTVDDTVIVVPSLPQRDHELPKMRDLQLEKTRTPGAGQSLLVVAASFASEASDSDRLVRFSPASVRLVANGKNHFPIGTVDAAGALVVNKPDDYLFFNTGTPNGKVAFVFEVDPGDVIASQVVGNGVFLEAKRLAREDLSGLAVKEQASVANPNDAVLRKSAPGAPATPAAPARAAPAQPPQPQGRDVMPPP